MAAAIPIEGTYTLDGLLQGKIPDSAHAEMAENLREWAQSATEAGFPFSLEIEGGQFSLLCGSEVRKLTAPGISVAETLKNSINALIETIPEAGRGQLFSTIRSSEYVADGEVQAVYMIGPDGQIRDQTRKVEIETRAPERPLTGKERLKMGLIVAGSLALLFLLSSFFIDYGKMFGGVRERFTVLTVENLDFDNALYDDYVKVTVEGLDRRRGGLVVKIERGPKWDEIAAERLAVTVGGIAWDELLVVGNLKRGYIPCLIEGLEKGVASEAKIPTLSLRDQAVSGAILPLPRNTRATRIVSVR